METQTATLLEGTGFRPATEIKKKKRMIINVQGLEDSGKTHFLCSCPDPIAIFDLDHNLEGVVNKFANKEIIYSPYYFSKPIKGGTETKIIKEAEKLWGNFMEDFKNCLKSDIATIGIDTADEAWSLIRLARLGKLTQVMPIHYGPVSAEFSQLIDMAKQSNTNLVFLSTLCPEYQNDSPTGRMVRKGFSQLDYKVQYSMQLSRPKKGEFQGKILKFKPDPQQVGEIMVAPDFQSLYNKAFNGVN